MTTEEFAAMMSGQPVDTLPSGRGTIKLIYEDGEIIQTTVTSPATRDPAHFTNFFLAFMRFAEILDQVKTSILAQADAEDRVIEPSAWRRPRSPVCHHPPRNRSALS